MSFASGLRQLLALRQTDVVAELRRGDTMESILNKHLLTVESASDEEILTSVLLLSPDGKHLTHGAAPSLPQPYVDAINGAEIGPSVGSCGTAAYLGEPVYVSDIATDPRWSAFRDLALSHGLGSCWSTPIRRSDGGVMGTFAIYHRTPGAPTRDELKMIDFISGNVARTITWARNPNATVDAVEMLPKQVAALQAVATAITQHGEALGEEGQEAIDAIVKDVDRFAEIVRAQFLPTQPEPSVGVQASAEVE
jgi:GAF domain-containing protein